MKDFLNLIFFILHAPMMPSREACFLFYDAIGRKVDECLELHERNKMKPLLDAIEAGNA